jgi:hypothetical protein
MRVDEVNAFIAEMKRPGFTKHLFECEGVSIDMDKLVVAGHSFGAMTAL